MSKTTSVIGIGSALACALLWTGCSDFGAAKPSASVEKKASAGPPASFDLKNAVGRPTPEFNLKDADGQAVRPANYKGKVVLLDFWATWCGPCKVEIPWFMEFEQQFKDRGFAVLGVSMDEDGWEAVKPYIQDLKINYRVLLGNEEISDLYGGLDSLPTTLLIDRHGKIASVHIGLSLGKEEFRDDIAHLLDAVNASDASAGHAGAILAAAK